MRTLIWIVPILALASCAGAAAVAAGTAASAPIVIGLLNSWMEAGILTEAQYQEAVAVFGQMGESFTSIMKLIEIWGGEVNQVQAQVQDLEVQAANKGISDEVLIGGVGVAGTAVAVYAKRSATAAATKVNAERDLRRAQRGEEID